jgi:hypothetical protein
MIYVFKTSVKSKSDVKKLIGQLNEHITDGTWNFDLDDCDKILRINKNFNNTAKTKHILKENGFECEELPD